MDKMAPKNAAPLHLSESTDAERSCVIRLNDDHLMLRTGRQIIDACRLDISIELWFQELQELVSYVIDWCRQHSTNVRACYIATGNVKMTLFVATETAEFDFGLAEQLAELNLHLVREYKVGTIEVHQVPSNEIDRFIDPESARLLYGTDIRSPISVDSQ